MSAFIHRFLVRIGLLASPEEDQYYAWADTRLDELALQAEVQPCPTCNNWPSMCNESEHAHVAAVQRLAELCKCACMCHRRVTIYYPGPCAGCCNPGDDCDCGRALAYLLLGSNEDDSRHEAEFERYLEERGR